MFGSVKLVAPAATVTTLLPLASCRPPCVRPLMLPPTVYCALLVPVPPLGEPPVLLVVLPGSSTLRLQPASVRLARQAHSNAAELRERIIGCPAALTGETALFPTVGCSPCGHPIERQRRQTESHVKIGRA